MNSITKIIIGPAVNESLIREGVTLAVKTKGLEAVEIEPSKIPYRG